MPFLVPPPPGAGPRNDVKPLPVTRTPEMTLEDLAYARAWKLVEGVEVHQCTCQRCPRVWFTLQQRPPKTCPGCRSAWWTNPKTKNVSHAKDEETSGFKIAKKPKRKSVKGGKVGRPRKNAGAKLEENGRTASEVGDPIEIPEVPVELLGSLDQLETPSSEPEYRGAEESQGTVSPTPLVDNPISLPDADTVSPDQGVETRLPVDDGGSQDAAADPLADLSDEEFYQHS